MLEESSQPAQLAPKPERAAAKQSRMAREAAALRVNLKKRKEQARARSANSCHAVNKTG